MGTHPANPAAATDGTDATDGTAAADPIGDFPAPELAGGMRLGLNREARMSYGPTAAAVVRGLGHYCGREPRT